MKTLGEFYREKVLTFPERVTRQLPVVRDQEEQGRVERRLFGWCLVVQNKEIPCGSEAEARFLKLCGELGMSRVEVPADERYLSSILPEFERLKARVDEIMNSYLAGVDSLRVRHRVYARLLEGKAKLERTGKRRWRQR